jgi:hypothetical protein
VFAYQPRRIEINPIEVTETAPAAAPESAAEDPTGGKKRKRKRH